MRTLILGVFTVMSLVTCAFGDNSKDLTEFELPEGMIGNFGTVRSEVLKVFSAEENGARFRAYQVKWKGQDIIVSDMYGTTDFQRGDTITFMFQNIEVPDGQTTLKMLQFMFMDSSAFTPEE